MAQIIRYSETPVGPYDELALLPGYFNGVGPDGEKRKDFRVTGIWVSQEATLMNGRKNWNIPKSVTPSPCSLFDCMEPTLTGSFARHLARFSFTPSGPDSKALKVEVFPADTSSTRPFFSASIQPINYTPSFPFSSTWLGYLGMSTKILQPPLPEGKPANVVVGTDKWMRSNPTIKSSKAKMVWIDIKQPDDVSKHTGSGTGEGDSLLAKKGNENWWPGLRRWHLGMYCPDAVLELDEPEILE